MRVMRDAEAEPALGDSALSSAMSATLVNGRSSVSAAICRRIRCDPWPTSAAPMRTTARSIREPAISSTVAVDCSGNPNE